MTFGESLVFLVALLSILYCWSWPGLTTDFESVDVGEVLDILKIIETGTSRFLLKLTRYG